VLKKKKGGAKKDHCEERGGKILDLNSRPERKRENKKLDESQKP